MMRLALAGLAALALLFGGTGRTTAGVVVNGGFETGNFSGWTVIPAAVGSDVFVDRSPHQGVHAAWFGATDPPFTDTITQAVTLQAGRSYELRFWLANFGGSPTFFQASFDGTPLLTLTDPPAFDYTLYSFALIGTGLPADLSFSAYQPPNFFRLDDVAIVNTPEPSSLALGNLAVLAGVALRRRARRI